MFDQEESRVKSLFEELRLATEHSMFFQASQLVAQRRAGWIALSTLSSDANRSETVSQSRLAIRRDPMGRNAVRIWESFVIGAGLTWSLNKPNLVDPFSMLLQRTVENPVNRPVFSFEGQRKAYRTLLADGELYAIVFFGARGTSPKVRYLYDSTEFLRPIISPDDPDQILFYPRIFTKEKITFTADGPEYDRGDRQVQYIRAWDVNEQQFAKNPHKPPSNQILQNAVCVRLSINDVRSRGWPMTEPALDWIRAYKGFMEDRVTYSRAIAKFAWSLKGASSESQLKAAIDKLDQPIATPTGGSSDEQTPSLGVGKVFGSNTMDMTPINVSSGGMDSRADGRMIRQQVGAGMGITEPNLTGDPSVGNLASLTAMDGTMARNFETDQRMMVNHNRALMAALLTSGSTNPADIEKAMNWVEDNLDLEYDPVVGEDRPTMISATIGAAQFLPEGYIQRQLLKLMGENNPDAVLEAYANELPPPGDNNNPDGQTGSNDKNNQQNTGG